MLLSDFVTVALIPTLIQHSDSSEVDTTNYGRVQNQNGNSRALLNSRSLPLPRSSEESDIFGNDEFFNQRQPSPYKIQTRGNQMYQPIIRDPVLREIYEEERRLDLAGGDLDISSEEARELISFQRKKMNMMQNFARQASGVVGIPQTEPQGRSLYFGPRVNRFHKQEEDRTPRPTPTTTQYPILIPSSTSQPEEGEVEETPVASTEIPKTGRLAIGGVFGKVRDGVGSAISGVHRKIFGGSNTPSTTTPTPRPSSNNVYFPDDDKPSRRPGYQHTTSSPNSIVFGNDEEPTAAVPLNCTGFKTEYNGACYNVLQQLPCPTGQWLIEDDNTGKGKCVENKCASSPGTAFFGGKCVVVRDEGDHCHKGMITYIFKNGEVECDCKELYLFNQKDGNCYPAYHRGPCNAGEIFATKVTERGALPATCMRSKCKQDGYFCNAPSCPKDRNCIKLKTDCETGVWDIHPQKLTPACIGFDIYKPDKIIGNVPTLACAPGSRRDILGTCRKSSRINFS